MWTQKDQGASMKFWTKPIVRQYFHKGLLWRASSNHEVASYELFVDLLYVGIIAISVINLTRTDDGRPVGMLAVW